LLDLLVLLYSNERKACGRKIVRTALFCASILALLSGELNAAPATIEHSARLRSGPGTSYRVVATLPRGAAVDLSGCRDGWCEVAARGRRGYISQGLLALGTAPLPAAAPVRPRDDYDDDYPGFDFPGPTFGPAATVTVQPRWLHRRWSRSRYQWGPRRWRNYPIGGVPAVASPNRPAVGGLGGVSPPTSARGAVESTRTAPAVVPDSGRSPAPSVAAPAATPVIRSLR
jgi:Bacterial SH3 domain